MMKKIENKRANLLYQAIVHLIIIGLLFALFFLATVDKVSSRATRQQVLEKQVALLIDAGEPGMSFYINKVNRNGVIKQIRIENNNVYVDIDGLVDMKGYPYFTKYNINVQSNGDAFVITIK